MEIYTVGKLESNDSGRANVYISDLEVGASATVKVAAVINDKRGHNGDRGYIGGTRDRGNTGQTTDCLLGYFAGMQDGIYVKRDLVKAA